MVMVTNEETFQGNRVADQLGATNKTIPSRAKATVEAHVSVRVAFERRSVSAISPLE
jgi:hypothetical protein